MKTVKSESTIFFDVDDTLVLWQKPGKNVRRVAVTCPYSGEQYNLGIHSGHVKVLKDRKVRGSFIVVWSAGGYMWAEAVIKALKLFDYVDLIMSKPHAYVDDKKAEDIMGQHIYLSVNDKYGN